MGGRPPPVPLHPAPWPWMRRGLVYQNYTSQISPSAEPGCCLRQRHASRLIVLFNPQPTLVVHFGPFCCPSFPSFILHSTLDIPSDRHTAASVSCSSFSPFVLLIYNCSKPFAHRVDADARLPVVPFRTLFHYNYLAGPKPVPRTRSRMPEASIFPATCLPMPVAPRGSVSGI